MLAPRTQMTGCPRKEEAHGVILVDDSIGSSNCSIDTFRKLHVARLRASEVDHPAITSLRVSRSFKV